MVEAIHYACYPIVTDCCAAFEDILDHRRYGNVIPRNSKIELQKALCKAMLDPDLRNKGNAAKIYVDKNYNWQKIIKTLDEAFAER